MPVLLALGSAAVYGIADFLGGHASKRAQSLTVTLIGQAASLVLVLLALVILRDPVAPAADWMWGAFGGLGGFVGLVAFYHSLSHGAMSVVAPTTAMVSASLPVIVGVASGDRPGVWAIIGVVLALVSIALVSGAVGARGTHVARSVFAMAVVAGLGFGFIFVCLAQTSDDSSLWPLVSARLVSVTAALIVTTVRGVPRMVRGVGLLLALGAGVLDMTANVLYMEAARDGLLSLVSVIAAMYPVSTVALALTIDHERVERSQVFGMVLAAVALALVSLGA